MKIKSYPPSSILIVISFFLLGGIFFLVKLLLCRFVLYHTPLLFSLVSPSSPSMGLSGVRELQTHLNRYAARWRLSYTDTHTCVWSVESQGSLTTAKETVQQMIIWSLRSGWGEGGGIRNLTGQWRHIMAVSIKKWIDPWLERSKTHDAVMCCNTHYPLWIWLSKKSSFGKWLWSLTVWQFPTFSGDRGNRTPENKCWNKGQLPLKLDEALSNLDRNNPVQYTASVWEYCTPCSLGT